MDSKNTEVNEQLATDITSEVVESTENSNASIEATETLAADDFISTTPTPKEEDNKEEARRSTEEGIITAERRKYLAGERDWDDIPEWIQKKIQEDEGVNKTHAQPIVDLEKLKAETKEEIRFENKLQEFKELKLTTAKKETLMQEYKELVSAGLPRSKALDKAIRLAGVNADIEKARENGIKMAQMGIPRSGMQTPAQGEKSWDEMSDDELISMNEKIMGRG